jgi:hypothetical protein
MSIYGSPVTVLKFQMAPKLMLLISSGSKKKQPCDFTKVPDDPQANALNILRLQEEGAL